MWHSVAKCQELLGYLPSNEYWWSTSECQRTSFGKCNLHCQRQISQVPQPNFQPKPTFQWFGETNRCTHTLQQPEVTVADTAHLLVNWSKSFEGCDSSEVLNANVHTGSDAVEVTLRTKKQKLEQRHEPDVRRRSRLWLRQQQQQKITNVWFEY